MPKVFRFFIGLSLILLSLAPSQATDFSFQSPGGNIQVDLKDGANGLTYEVRWNQKLVLAASRLDVRVDGKDLTPGAQWGKPVVQEIDEKYRWFGGHHLALHRARAVRLPFTTASGGPADLELRLQNDGVAWRFRVPAQKGRKVEQEMSEWKLPLDSMVWFQNDLGAYEGIFDGAPLKSLTPPAFRYGGSLDQKMTIPLPLTAELPGGGYALLTEAAVYDFADSATRVMPDGSLRLFLQAQTGGWTTDQEVVQPWRVLVLATDLNALVNTDLVANLNPAASPELATADWIQPGTSSWQWWCSGGPKLEEQSQWLDWTVKCGFPYYLIDEGWKNWKSGDRSNWDLLKQVADEAKGKGVKLWIWINSKDVADHASLVAALEKTASLGIVGVKIDFIPRASREWSNWYVDVLREAARVHLMVDFHGATKPTGLERTWPNEVSRESVRGHEWHINRYNRVLPPHHDTILPFTRYVIGHGDYTPTVFNPTELKGYTWPRELAQAIVFTSPYLCYADHPKNYLENPAFDVMKDIPSTWDETRVLPGSAIGECVAFARRKDKDWFIGVINGGQARTLKLPLDFLSTGTYRTTLLAEDAGKNDAFVRSEKSLTSQDTLTVTLRGSSGFVARCKAFTPQP